MKLYRKNITRLLLLALLLVLRTRNNTDSNKLVIFSGIASYYGDNYIVLHYHMCLLVAMMDVQNFIHKVLAVIFAEVQHL